MIRQASIYELTLRQKEILELTSQGLTTAQIAKHLWLEVQTIKSHRTNIYSILGVKTNIQAIRKAIELGIISCPCKGNQVVSEPEVIINGIRYIPA